MRLTALEIKKKDFQQKMRGIDQDEVQAFLDLVSREVELLTREKRELEEELQRVRAVAGEYSSIESTLERTLVAAQQTAVRMEEQARREAELILREATTERDRLLGEMRRGLEASERELVRLRSEYEMTLARVKSHMAGLVGFITSLETAPVAAPVAPVSAPGGPAAPAAPSSSFGAPDMNGPAAGSL